MSIGIERFLQKIWGLRGNVNHEKIQTNPNDLSEKWVKRKGHELQRITGS